MCYSRFLFLVCAIALIGACAGVPLDGGRNFFQTNGSLASPMTSAALSGAPTGTTFVNERGDPWTITSTAGGPAPCRTIRSGSGKVVTACLTSGVWQYTTLVSAPPHAKVVYLPPQSQRVVVVGQVSAPTPIYHNSVLPARGYATGERCYESRSQRKTSYFNGRTMAAVLMPRSPRERDSAKRRILGGLIPNIRWRESVRCSGPTRAVTPVPVYQGNFISDLFF